MERAGKMSEPSTSSFTVESYRRKIWLFIFLPLTSWTVVRTVKKSSYKILQSDWLLAILISALNRTVF